MHLVKPEAILETARLWLEPLQPSHALALYEPLQSHAIYEFLPEDPPTSPEALATRYHMKILRYAQDDRVGIQG